MSKHLINNKENWAKSSLKGYLYTNNENLISLEEYPNVIARKDFISLQETNSRVALLSGGGSGHEPAHLGFIDHGMLTGVVCGDLFASPSTQSILAAIRMLGSSNKSGVLLIVKNYTGDRLNFGLASKRAQLEGINVDWVLVDDDIALIDNQNPDDSVGRRGLCGTILIHKIAGSLAEQRKSLKEIKENLDFILKGNYLRTIGVSLSGRVQLPGETEPTSDLGSQIEIGLGIHGEAGRHRVELIDSKNLVKMMLNDYLLKNNKTNEICLMVNNLGGLSNLELNLLVKDCVEFLQESKPDIATRRIYSGTFMTSLNMNGFSLTLLNLTESNSQLILNCLDSTTLAPAWPKNHGIDFKKFEYTKSSFSTAVKSSDILNSTDYLKFSSYDNQMEKMFELILKTISEDIILFKEHLNKLDQVCGDGDCGNSLSNIGENILKDIESKKFNFDQPHQVVLHLSDIFENGGGSLCILLSIFMSSAAKSFNKNSIDYTDENKQIFWIRIWRDMIERGINAVQEYGRAKVNQRSIIDPLTAILNYLTDYINNQNTSRLESKMFLKNLVDVTYKSVESTAQMKPRVGRASYVDPSLIKTPDAGASGISSIITSIYKAFLVFYSN